MQILQNGTAITGFISRKAEALLCYLVMTGQPHSRLALTDLLWDKLPEKNARRNLRVTLTNLRQLVGPYLTITRQSVVFNSTSPYWLDVAQFNAPFTQQPEPVGSTKISLFEQSAALYAGDFLAGFHLCDTPVWEEWMLHRQEQLSQRAWHIHRQLAVHYAGQGHYQKSLSYVSRLLQLNPLYEETHRLLMWLLAANGQRSAALFQYERCRHLLQENLDVAPAAATTQLYQQICEGHLIELSLSTDLNGPLILENKQGPRPAHNLPAQTTSFIGRAEEMKKLLALLRQTACRVVTVAGLGGVGKTRLAIQAGCKLIGDNNTIFPDGIYFVPLNSVSSVESVIPALANRLPGGPFDQGDLKKQLLTYLQSKKMLLIIDNFEHLLPAASLINEVLESAPGIKIIVTSRESLNLPGEWTLPIRGLSFPEDTGTLSEAQTYEAVQLFLSSACRVNPQFALTTTNLPYVMDICRLVEGLPLAVELAAAWTRSLSCAEIAVEIEHNLDFLGNISRRGVPQRHQSIRAVVDHSWKLLTVEEQEKMQQLSLLEGSFSGEVARIEAGVSVAMLANLVHKFMVRRHTCGRYEIHPLFRRYIQAHRQSRNVADFPSKGSSGWYPYLAGEEHGWETAATEKP